MAAAAAVWLVWTAVSAWAAGPDAGGVLNAEWTGCAVNPVFEGRPGQWDARIRERGWIMKDGDLWKLWYTGYNTDDVPLQMKLGYATSEDGITWTRWSDNPIYDDVWTEDVMVLKHRGRYIMVAEGARDQPHMLESDDGIRWTRIGGLDVRRQNGTPVDPGPLGTPVLLRHQDLWYLFYERYDAGVWVATSPDRRVWTNVTDDPVLRPGPADWDARMIAMNQIVHIGDRFVAVMHGTGSPAKPRDWCTYLAVSRDLKRWSKLRRGPLLPVEENKSSGLLLHDGRQWRLYTMHAQVDLWLPRAD